MRRVTERSSPVGPALTALALVPFVGVAPDDDARRLLLGWLVVGGLAAAGLGWVALIRGRMRWARLNRRSGALLVAAGLIAALVGGALSGQATSTGAAAPTSPPGQGSSTASPSPSGSTPWPSTTTITSPPVPHALSNTALAALATLAVKGRAPRKGYERDLFGQAWADVDHNGCDTRNDVLRRDLTAYHLKAGTHGCVVLSGALRDPYTGTAIAFVRGQDTSTKVQIDHVVALSDAWQKGAQQLPADTRRALANDLLNLLAVDGLTNERKSDGDAATWLPPDARYRCSYAARQVAVKAKYLLWVTGAERDALRRILATCPSQTLPTAAALVLGGGLE